jgi:uncharacterized Tic20 family protein
VRFLVIALYLGNSKQEHPMSSDPSNLESPQFAVTPEDRQWAMFAHLSSLLAMWLGGLGFLGPLIIWLIKKEQSAFIDDQGKEALNFNLTVLIATIALGLLALPVVLLTVGLGLLVIVPLFLILGVVAIIMPILGAIKANAGEAYRYPYIIRIVT